MHDGRHNVLLRNAAVDLRRDDDWIWRNYEGILHDGFADLS